MDKKTVEKQLKQIKDAIYKNDHFYYNLDQPKISDYEYDQLFNTLIQLETQYPELLDKNSPSQRVPGQPLSHFEKSPHKTPMLSLQNTYNIEEIHTFYDKTLSFLNTSFVEFLLEPKLDGVAINLTYENSLLTKALTRGNGIIGENVFENIKTIRSIPLKLLVPHQTVEIRGEIVLFKNDFHHINTQQEKQGLSLFANPRNMAAGSLRQLNPKVTASRPLRFFTHSRGLLKNSILKTQSAFLTAAKDWGLPVLPVLDFHTFQAQQKISSPVISCVLCKSKKDIVKYFQIIEQLRDKLMFEIDGVVIKVNCFAEQEKLGSISRSPRWARASKFKPETAQTYIKDIYIQVGRTGVLTPVATVHPVQVGGVIITNATLHNISEISKKDIRIGDHVIIGRAGDVIPEIIKIILSKRKPHFMAFKMPQHCVSCLSPVQIVRNIYFCINPLCPSVMLQTLIHFASKKAMNIESLGNKIIGQLYRKKIITTFSDIYKISQSQLLGLDKQGKKSSQRILSSIEKSKKITLPVFIFSLGIRHIGEQTALNLSTFFITKAFKKCDTLNANDKHVSDKKNWPLPLILFSIATTQELKTIPDVGEVVAHSIKKTFNQEGFIKEINLLFSYGVKIDFPIKNAENSILESQKIAITGSFPQSRSQLEKHIRLLGGQIKNTLSEDTSYLLTGLNKTKQPSKKIKQAQKFNIPCISWEEFQQKIKT